MPQDVDGKRGRFDRHLTRLLGNVSVAKLTDNDWSLCIAQGEGGQAVPGQRDLRAMREAGEAAGEHHAAHDASHDGERGRTCRTRCRYNTRPGWLEDESHGRALHARGQSGERYGHPRSAYDGPHDYTEITKASLDTRVTH
jgi:hypothetical protein